jgi:hypothetical protein
VTRSSPKCRWTSKPASISLRISWPWPTSGTVIHSQALGGQVLARSTLGIAHAIGQKWGDWKRQGRKCGVSIPGVKMFPKLLEEEALTSRLIVAQCMPWSVEGRQIHAGCVDANGLPLAGGKLEAERNMALPLSFDREAAGRSGGIIARCNAPNAGC